MGDRTFDTLTLTEGIVADATDRTKLISFDLSGDTTGTTSSLTFAQTTDQIVTFPDNITNPVILDSSEIAAITETPSALSLDPRISFINSNIGNSSALCQWGARIAGGGAERGNGIYTDGSGNVYITGNYIASPVTIYNGDGTIFGTLANSGAPDAYIVKYNSSGTGQWSARVAGGNLEEGMAVAVGGSGNVYTTGVYFGTLVTIYNADTTIFGTLTNIGSADIYIVKYNSVGVVQWTARIASNDNDQSACLAVDPSTDDIVIGGMWRLDTLTLYNKSGAASAFTLAGSSSFDAFVAKYNSSGIAQWAAKLVSGSTDQTLGLAVDSSSNIYATGEFRGVTLTITNANGSTAGNLTGTGTPCVFAVKFNSSGIGQWKSRMIGANNNIGKGVTLDSSGNSYFVGNFNSSPLSIYNGSNGLLFGTLTPAGSTDNFLVKYNSVGAVQWTLRLGGTSSDTSSGCFIDSSDNVYMTGFYVSNPLSIYNEDGSLFDTMSNIGGINTHVVKYNSSGFAQWGFHVAGTVQGKGVALDSSDNVFICGTYQGVITFYNSNQASSGITLSGIGIESAFIGKYSQGVIGFATLADPSQVFEKVLTYNDEVGTAGSVQVAVSNVVDTTGTDRTTISFPNKGTSASLIWNGTEWEVQAEVGSISYS